ncbi:putative reverse transcriptase domain-containing protein, partial [Tanacetum coccineum]
ADALSRKKIVKPKRIQAMNMTLQSSTKDKILAAQEEASDEFVGLQKGLDELIEHRSGGALYYLDRIWVSLKGDVKAEHQRPSGLLQQPEISEHGVLISIISDRDSRFTSMFWQSMQEGQLIGPELVQETTEKILQIKDRRKAARDRQKSYADKRRKPLEFSVAYRLRLAEELNGVHDTFHVSNLKKCLADPTLQVPLDEIQVDAKLNFVEEPVEILEREFKKLKRSIIAIIRVRWNSKRGPKFTWEREDQMRLNILRQIAVLFLDDQDVVCFVGGSRVRGEWDVGSGRLVPLFVIWYETLQKALGTRLDMSVAYHPQMDGQSEHTIQTLKDILRACAEIEESRLIGPELVQETTDKVVLIKERLKEARDCQKSYVDNRCKPLEFEDHLNKEGMDRVLENGSWLIKMVPLILNVWSPDSDLFKEEIKKVPVWVKFHHVPIVAYSEVGLSLITTQVGKPIRLDAYTSNMCLHSWAVVVGEMSRESY